MVNRPSANPPGIVGAAIVPHAPQFLTLPETEDKAQVARVNAAMRAIGDKFRALDPDLLIVLSNAHCDDMVVHCVPPFALHCGRARRRQRPAMRAPGRSTARPATRWCAQLLDLGFDPAFTLDAGLGTAFTIPLEFCGYPRETPFLPIFVNAYVPPQPTPERCFAFGRALGAGDRARRPPRSRAGERRPVALPGHAAIPASRHRHRPGHLRAARGRQSALSPELRRAPRSTAPAMSNAAPCRSSPA